MKKKKVSQCGQTRGRVCRDVDSAEAVSFLIAMVEGYGSLANNAQNAEVMKAGGQKHRWVSQSLRAPKEGKDGVEVE